MCLEISKSGLQPSLKSLPATCLTLDSRFYFRSYKFRPSQKDTEQILPSALVHGVLLHPVANNLTPSLHTQQMCLIQEGNGVLLDLF